MWTAVNAPDVIRTCSECDALKVVFAVQSTKLLLGK